MRNIQNNKLKSRKQHKLNFKITASSALLHNCKTLILYRYERRNVEKAEIKFLKILAETTDHKYNTDNRTALSTEPFRNTTELRNSTLFNFS